MAALPADFLAAPLAHRALHDVTNQRPENSRAAVLAAVSAGYGIEIDLQLSADGQAMVFHDYKLDRLTGRRGMLGDHQAAELQSIPLTGTDEGIATLHDILELVAGRVAVLIELKDQDGAMGSNVGGLEIATSVALSNYQGAVAVMSFNPHSMITMARLAPKVARGLVTGAYDASDWPKLPATLRDHLRGISDLAASGASFISHQASDLSRRRVSELRAQGLPVLCWTVRSPEQEAQARLLADNITFEGYCPALTA